MRARIAKLNNQADPTAAFDHAYRTEHAKWCKAHAWWQQAVPMCMDSGLTWVAKQCTNVQL